MTEHSKLTWTFEDTFGGYDVRDAEENIIMYEGRYWSDPPSKTHAKLIVDSVNKAQRLQEALEGMLSMIDDGVPEYEWDEIKNKARNILKEQ